MRRWSRQLVVSVAVAFALTGAASAALGDPASNSTSYRVVESEIGGNGQFHSVSTAYGIDPNVDDGGSSAGGVVAGSSSSTAYNSTAGFNTTAQPSLTMVVNTSSVNLGALSTASATFGTATFDVTNYSSYGYAVSVIGTAPTYGAHSLAALSTDTASSAGTEQFGINTVLNTSASQGANPVQLPSSSFSYGVAGDGITGTFGTTRPYTQSDKWRFVPGETIASAPKSSGDTQFTVTFLANISAINTPISPGGAYIGNISFVATGTY